MTSDSLVQASGPPPGGSAGEDQAEKRRMPLKSLVGLAAGGVIGSGWLLSGVQVQAGAPGWQAVGCWFIGGVLMGLVAVVMVELSVRRPMTGGQAFLPFRTSGPYLAMVIGAGIWVFYTVNPASEMAAVVQGIQEWPHWRWLTGHTQLTWTCVACLLLLLVTAVNLCGSELFLRINNWLTLFKVAVPLALLLLLACAATHIVQLDLSHYRPAACTTRQDSGGLVAILRGVPQGAVFYAYLGFQGPLDFAGSVKRVSRAGRGQPGRRAEPEITGMYGEGDLVARRLRVAVYGTIAGSILLYIFLQLIVIYLRDRGALSLCGSPYVAFIQLATQGWLRHASNFVLDLDMVLSPAGAAMVFTYLLTREIAQLSRVGLTHGGLWKSRNSKLARKRPGSPNVYWLILVIDFVLSGVALCVFRGNWGALGTVTSVLALIVYATPCVVLATQAGRKESGSAIPRPKLHQGLALLAFVSISVIYFLAGWGRLWPGMAALTLACVVLFALPEIVAGSRVYDAQPWSPLDAGRPAKRAAMILFGWFAALTALSPLNRFGWAAVLAVGGCAVAAFCCLVWTSGRYVKITERTQGKGQ
jgi:amino acid transporter